MKQKKEMTCCIAVNALGEHHFVGRKELDLISHEGPMKVAKT